MLGFRWSGGGGAWCSAAPDGFGFDSSLRRSIPTLLQRPSLTLLRSPDGGGGGAARSADVVELEYADLNLKDLYGAGHLGQVRIRQHVNPLSSAFSAPVQVPDWKAVFQGSTLPLMVDIGCGSGRFLVWLAKNFPEPRNYLGLEIRQKLVQRSQFWVNELGLRNIYFMFANASVSFERLVSSYPGPLTLVSILCPDPHFKKRHHKRRVLQKPLVDSISKNLCMEGQLTFLRKVAKRQSHLSLYADELGKGLVGELDYTKEAADAFEFLEAHSQYSFISAPKVLRKLTRKRVLTMEWMIGENQNNLLLLSGDLVKEVINTQRG